MRFIMKTAFLFAPLLITVSAALNAQPRGQQPTDNNSLKFADSRSEVYKQLGDVKLKIHIFEPAGHSEGDARPAIVFFFGGGWKSGSPQQFEQQCRYLASRGMVAMTADYRVSSRHRTQAKHCVQDGKSAIRWIRQHADRLGIDPERIAAGGGSAGGHVAACTGVISGWEEPGEAVAISSVPNALVLFNPAVALAEIAGEASIPADQAGNLEERCGTKPINLSPAHHVREGLPPTIMFFGSEDFLLSGAHYFDDQMRSHNNRCELKLYPGQSHGFFNFSKGNKHYFVETLAAADQFLVSIGYLQGPANVREFFLKDSQ